MLRPLLLSALVTAVLLAGCGEQSKETQPQPEDSAYKIIHDQHFSTAKRNVDVVLDERLDTAKLSEIAVTIKNGDKQTYDKTFIGYYIANEDQTGGYWATATFDPTLKVRVLGISRQQITALKASMKPGPDNTVGGAWLDDRPHVRATLQLLRKNGGVVMKSVSADGNTTLTKMDESQKNGKTILKNPQDTDSGDYFVINENGQLEFWSKDGRYYTASSL